MSLIKYIPLINTIEDKCGGAVTISSTAPASGAEGLFGSGYTFGPTSTYVKAENLRLTSEMSFSLWVKFSSITSGFLLDCRSGGTGYQPLYFNSTEGMQFYSSGSATGGYINIGSLSAGTWYHLVATIKNNVATIYLNGVSKGAVSATGLDVNSYATIGNRYSLATGAPASIIQDVRIYNHALSLTEIKELARGLLIHYKFNDSVGPNLFSAPDFVAKHSAGGNCTATNYGYNGLTLTKTTTSTDVYAGAVATTAGATMTGDPYKVPVSGGKTYCFSYRLISGPPIEKSYRTEWNSSNISLLDYNNRRLRYAWIVEGDVYKHFFTTQSATTTLTFRLGVGYFEGAIGATTVIENISLVPIDEFYDTSDHNNRGVPSGEIASGTLVATEGISYTATSPRGGSLTLDGASSNAAGVKFNNPKSGLVATNYTMAFWVYPTKNSRGTIFGDYGTSGVNFNLERHGSSPYGLRVYYNGDKLSNIADTAMPTGQWTHVALVYNLSEKTMRVCINGVLKTTISSLDASGFTKTGGIYWIGRDGRGNDTSWQGHIADFRFYVTALSADAIKSIYEAVKKIDHLGNTSVVAISESGEATSLSSINKTGTQKVNYLSEIIHLDDGSVWMQVSHHDNKAGTNLFSSSDPFETEFVYHNKDCWAAFNLIKQHGLYNNRYEFMAMEQLTTTDNFIIRRWAQTVSPFTATYSTVSPGHSNVTHISNMPSMNGGMYKLNSSTYFCITNASNGNWFGAFGAWNKHGTGIPTFNNSSTTGIFDLFVRVDPAIGNKYREFKNGVIMPHSINII